MTKTFLFFHVNFFKLMKTLDFIITEQSEQ